MVVPHCGTTFTKQSAPLVNPSHIQVTSFHYDKILTSQMNPVMNFRLCLNLSKAALVSHGVIRKNVA